MTQQIPEWKEEFSKFYESKFKDHFDAFGTTKDHKYYFLMGVAAGQHFFNKPENAAKIECVKKLIERSEVLIQHSKDFLEATRGYISDTDYDADGFLASSNANLEVTSIPQVREALKPFQEAGCE